MKERKKQRINQTHKSVKFLSFGKSLWSVIMQIIGWCSLKRKEIPPTKNVTWNRNDLAKDQIGTSWFLLSELVLVGVIEVEQSVSDLTVHSE